MSVSHRVDHDYLVEQTELEKDLFAEIEAVEDSSLESSTLVTVECKLFIVSIKFFFVFSDLPKKPELVQGEPGFKGDELTLTCHLEDPGYPEAEEFIWLKYTDIGYIWVTTFT